MDLSLLRFVISSPQTIAPISRSKTLHPLSPSNTPRKTKVGAPRRSEEWKVIGSDELSEGPCDVCSQNLSHSIELFAQMYMRVPVGGCCLNAGTVRGTNISRKMRALRARVDSPSADQLSQNPHPIILAFHITTSPNSVNPSRRLSTSLKTSPYLSQ